MGLKSLNSTMVRLKLILNIPQQIFITGLNSTMVRLKRKKYGRCWVKICKSQFHYGSIKTPTFDDKNNAYVVESQFHYGSIKTV